ncbi:hypothetical protein BS50DRAFT_572160 [Corynespora cassiicola Philippines]|uniref:Uncharacterized protein n=1 Tax=Corynespora cassiicola Philippines TaxID=1448308 RepID=A0A2T2NUB0_CORCC|nr:hypothetical protein BS50DRAFT_572160 [Corynespora cassiicola Philippines]
MAEEQDCYWYIVDQTATNGDAEHRGPFFSFSQVETECEQLLQRKYGLARVQLLLEDVTVEQMAVIKAQLGIAGDKRDPFQIKKFQDARVVEAIRNQTQDTFYVMRLREADKLLKCPKFTPDQYMEMAKVIRKECYVKGLFLDAETAFRRGRNAVEGWLHYDECSRAVEITEKGHCPYVALFLSEDGNLKGIIQVYEVNMDYSKGQALGGLGRG